MTNLPAPIANHVHVSEREVAHRWKNGKYDNAAWEDCSWDTALEYARAVGVDAPATHAEAEELRATVKGPLGGTRPDEVAAGLKRKYGLSVIVRRSFAVLWLGLNPGTVASVSGNMDAFWYLHRLRRHQRSFNGAHSVLVFRVDDTDRVWWCDPLGPKDGYVGEWVTKDELHRFVSGLPEGGHYIGKIAATMAAIPEQPKSTEESAMADIVVAEAKGAQAFLREIGADPLKPAMVRAVVAWARQESGFLSRVIGNNVFNIRPGAATTLSSGKRSGPGGYFLTFPSVEVGFRAAAHVLVKLSPHYGYGEVVKAARANDALGFLAALAQSSWSASHYGVVAGVNPRYTDNHLVKNYVGLRLTFKLS